MFKFILNSLLRQLYKLFFFRNFMEFFFKKRKQKTVKASSRIIRKMSYANLSQLTFVILKNHLLEKTTRKTTQMEKFSSFMCHL